MQEQEHERQQERQQWRQAEQEPERQGCAKSPGSGKGGTLSECPDARHIAKITFAVCFAGKQAVFEFGPAATATAAPTAAAAAGGARNVATWQVTPGE